MRLNEILFYFHAIWYFLWIIEWIRCSLFLIPNEKVINILNSWLNPCWTFPSLINYFYDKANVYVSSCKWIIFCIYLFHLPHSCLNEYLLSTKSIVFPTLFVWTFELYKVIVEKFGSKMRNKWLGCFTVRR